MASVKRKLILQTVIGAAALLAAVFIGAVVVGYLSASGVPVSEGAVRLWVSGLFAVASMVGAFVIGVQWMRSIDEAAREAHKAAWYWGGTAGMSVGGVLLILATLPQAAAISIPSVLPGRSDPAAYAVTGAFAVTLLMLVGYIIVWAWWWLARSRG